ncbi:MAG: T9SS type B sorting domain-containing protein, partial [Eudoraea sp.]|nr:T9SS type B sorting domain-containing protein [Eudoraea sp.]
VSSGAHNVFVRDKNGCGITRGLVEAELSRSDFPEFFTPNGDGINDFWHIRPTKEGRVKELEYLQVFDRYGVLLTQITKSSRGWDGSFNGRPLPSSVYWFKAADNYKNVVRGYFLLKR